MNIYKLILADFAFLLRRRELFVVSTLIVDSTIVYRYTIIIVSIRLAEWIGPMSNERSMSIIY